MKPTSYHPKQTLPLVSVIISYYNKETTIKNTIKSVLRQTYNKIEVIVVDDGSEQSIESKLLELNDERIHYYRLAHSNANYARNYGIMKSKGSYIAMLDADDEWMENHLTESIDVLEVEKVDGVYGSLILQEGSNHRTFYTRALNPKEKMIDFLLSMGCGAQTSTLVMTAQSVRATMWDVTLNRHQDYDFLVRYNKQFKLVAVLSPTVIYHITPRTEPIDYKSCIRFIRAYRNEISPLIYTNYHISMLINATKHHASQDIISYYQKERIRYKQYVTYSMYHSIVSPQNWFERIWYKLKYIWGICM